MDAKKSQPRLEDTQPIPVYNPATEVAQNHDEQRDGRIVRVNEGINLIGTDGMIAMSGEEWRQYIGLKPSIFPSRQAVQDWFDAHAPKPNDADNNA